MKNLELKMNYELINIDEHLSENMFCDADARGEICSRKKTEHY